MARPRDSQRRKFFEAECLINQQGGYSRDVADLEKLLDKVGRSRWWKGFPTDNAFKGSRELRLTTPRPGMLRVIHCFPASDSAAIYVSGESTTLHILHSLSHVLQPRESAYHGPEFVSIYLRMIERFFGKPEKEQAKRILRAYRVKTKAVSPEARANMRVAYIARVNRDVPKSLMRILKELE